jgi:hypothetical protein
MKIKKNAFSTLVLELFCQSKSKCYRLKIQKVQKATRSTVCTVLYIPTNKKSQFSPFWIQSEVKPLPASERRSHVKNDLFCS